MKRREGYKIFGLGGSLGVFVNIFFSPPRQNVLARQRITSSLSSKTRTWKIGCHFDMRWNFATRLKERQEWKWKFFEASICCSPCLSLSNCQYCQSIKDHFWHLWICEYICVYMQINFDLKTAPWYPSSWSGAEVWDEAILARNFQQLEARKHFLRV